MIMALYQAHDALASMMALLRERDVLCNKLIEVD